MDDKRIEAGDEVFVMYPGHPENGRQLLGIVHNIPRATGDSWIIESTGQVPGEIYYISEPIGDLDLFYCFNGTGMKPDSRILMRALESNEVFEGRNLRQELELRGYDITTLKFSIMKKPESSHPHDSNQS